jgi:hypothetical protein
MMDLIRIREFDLLRRVGLDDRAAALLDKAAHPDAAAFEPFWLNSRPRQTLAEGV